jgi:hypothetical protein
VDLDDGHADDYQGQIRETIGRLLAAFAYDVEAEAMAPHNCDDYLVEGVDYGTDRR